jgi:hypothetical protein
MRCRKFLLSWRWGQQETPWPESASELHRPSDRRLLAKLLPTFADRGYHVVSVMDPYGRILGFLDRSRYFFFQVAPKFYSRGWVDPVPDLLLLRKSDSAGNRTWTSGSVARNSHHWTTAGTYKNCESIYKTKQATFQKKIHLNNFPSVLITD